MTAQIRIIHPDGRSEERVLAFGTYVAGREAGDIVLGDPNTSGRHAQIDVQPGRVMITDLGSTNGTYDMQGQRLSAPSTMIPEQPFRLGTTTITLMAPQRTAAGTQVMPQAGVMPMPGASFPGGAPLSPAAAPYSPPATAPYAQPAQPQSFGQPPGAPQYAPPPGAPYGQPPAAPFGQPPGAAPYGQPPGAPFGQPPGGPYGQPPGAAPPYGQPAPGFAPGAPFAPTPIGALAPGSEAQWGPRAVGYLIDHVLVGAVATVLIIGFMLVSGLVAGAAGSVATTGAAGEEAATAALGMFSGSMCAMLAILPLSMLAVGAYNRVYLVSKRGYSIGQGVMKLKVVDTNGALLPIGTAAIRLIAQIALGMIPIASFVDLLWPLWDPRRQTLHDKAVGSFVITDPARQ